MNEYRKMKKRKQKTGEIKNLSDICTTILFTVFVFAFFLLMFTYADTLSQTRERSFRINVRGHDKFAVKKYTWKCQNAKCVRFLTDEGERISLETCNMVCSQPSLWPKPRSVKIYNKASSIIDLQCIKIEVSGQGSAKKMVQDATYLFVKNLQFLKPTNKSLSSATNLTVQVLVKNYNVTKLKLNTDEAYRLVVQKKDKNVFAHVSGDNFFGVRHGLETLSQLIWYDEVEDNLKILHDVDIDDSPQFPHRGVMIDTARNFFPIYQLKKIVDGMSMSKLNVLHLHLTDAVSFPVVLPSIKELAEYGAYGNDMVYTSEDIKDLIRYARLRGVRVLPEIDAPSHVNAGWNFAKELFNEDYVICGKDDVLNGHLNPDNDNALEALQNIYTDLLELFGSDEMFHIGGDEVNLSCWRETEAARKFSNMKDFWMEYTKKMLESLKRANDGKYPEKIVMWSSPLTEYHNFDFIGNIVVQFWLGQPDNFLRKGHSVIYSTVGHWYLDCGFGPWKPSMNRGVCDPYTPWQTFYKYRPWKEFGHEDLALGGEVCLWAEQVEVDTLETRVWPRSAAFAERIWSDPETFNDYDVYTRLVSFRDRLIVRGIKSAAMWPRWCSQNPGKC